MEPEVHHQRNLPLDTTLIKLNSVNIIMDVTYQRGTYQLLFLYEHSH
jgi:hypothetical protein